MIYISKWTLWAVKVFWESACFVDSPRWKHADTWSAIWGALEPETFPWGWMFRPTENTPFPPPNTRVFCELAVGCPWASKMTPCFGGWISIHSLIPGELRCLNQELPRGSQLWLCSSKDDTVAVLYHAPEMPSISVPSRNCSVFLDF